MLSQIKSLKMMGLSHFMSNSILAQRSRELEMSKRYRWIQSAVATTGKHISNSSTSCHFPRQGSILIPVCSSALTLLVEHLDASVSLISPVAVIIAAIFFSDGLDIAQAFTALSIMSLITNPLALLLASWPILRASVACFDRVQAFLLLEERQDYRTFLNEHISRNAFNHQIDQFIHQERPSQESTELEVLPTPRWSAGSDAASHIPINIGQDACFSYRDGRKILNAMNLQVPLGQLTVITGEVGSGKSSLLKAMLGELSISSGKVDIRTKTIAYCDQTPWLNNTTIMENIIGNLPMEESWYSQVIEICGLTQDFRGLCEGDQMRVGSGGVALSGGQRQRVVSAMTQLIPPIGLSHDMINSLMYTCRLWLGQHTPRSQWSSWTTALVGWISLLLIRSSAIYGDQRASFAKGVALPF